MLNRSSKKLKQISTQMKEASSYRQWFDAASRHDGLSGASNWRRTERTKLYDYAQIRKRLQNLRRLRENNDSHGLLFALNEGVHGNIGGMGKSSLYAPSKVGTKHLVEEYVDEIVASLKYIANVSPDVISLNEKLDFFHRASLCYGRSALMLSGGGALGAFHIGVVKALLEQDLLPNVISGSSAGSVVCAIYGTHTDPELQELFTPEEMLEEAKRHVSWLEKILYGNRPRAKTHELEELVINRLIPDLTFQEAYERTGRSINISIAPVELHQTSRLLNAITTPNVYIRSAVRASTAVPGVYPPVMLEAKNVHGERQPYLPTRRWVDGSISDDLPVKRLARLYGVNHYIGSLINPIVILSEDGWDQTKVPAFVRELSHKAAARTAKTISAISQRFTPKSTRFNIAINMLASVLNQEYSADISVYPDFHRFDFRKILSHIEEKDFLELSRQGELATWRKIEQIRTNTKISKTLEKILDDFGENDLLHVVRQKKQRKVQRKVSEEAMS